jgi:hypothetical protein
MLVHCVPDFVIAGLCSFTRMYLDVELLLFILLASQRYTSLSERFMSFRYSGKFSIRSLQKSLP